MIDRSSSSSSSSTPSLVGSFSSVSRLTLRFSFVRSFVLHSQPGVLKQREEVRGEDGDGAGAKGPDTDERLSAEQARARRACESDGGDGKAKEARDGVMERKANPYADDAAEVIKN